MKALVRKGDETKCPYIQYKRDAALKDPYNAFQLYPHLLCTQRVWRHCIELKFEGRELEAHLQKPRKSHQLTESRPADKETLHRKRLHSSDFQ
jgi:hypothetical protein